MYLDPREYEYLLKLRPGLQKEKFRKPIVFDGNAVILRLVNVRTHRGLVRFSLDPEGMPVSTGATTNPVPIRDPYSLIESGDYMLYFHLSLRTDEIPKSLQKNIVIELRPTNELADTGLSFNKLTKSGDLCVSAHVGRRIQIYGGYPVAELRFIAEDIVKTGKAKKDDGKNTPDRA